MTLFLYKTREVCTVLNYIHDARFFDKKIGVGLLYKLVFSSFRSLKNLNGAQGISVNKEVVSRKKDAKKCKERCKI